jgi:hypothetical protein
MSESLSYCSVAWPIQPTVLPRPKSATAPPAGKASVRASVASAKSTVGRPPMSLYTTDGDKQLYALALDVENTALRLLAEHKPGETCRPTSSSTRRCCCTGSVYRRSSSPPPSRSAGWATHCFEQRALDRLIRPQSVYVGSNNRRWESLEGV